MLDAYKKYWKNYVNFAGRSSRSDFWWVILMNAIIGLILGIVLAFSMAGALSSYSSYDTSYGYTYSSPDFGPGFGIMTVLLIIWELANFLPGLALSVRRLRDAGYHWAFILLPLISLIPILDWFFGWVT